MDYADKYIVQTEELVGIANQIRTELNKNITDEEKKLTQDNCPITLEDMVSKEPETEGEERVVGKIEQVFNSGYDKGKTEGSDTEQAYNQGVADGKQAEYDTFWTIYQTSGKRSDYRYAFSNHGWNNITYNPKYPVVPVSAEGMYFLSSLNEIANVDTSKLTSAPKMFYYAKAKALGEMNLSKCTNLEYWCSDAKSLVSIDKIISSEITAWHNTSFDRCTALTHVIFEGTIGKSISFSDSPLLTTGAEGETTNSVQSIIDALMTITDGVARTITVHQTVRNKLTPTQEDTIVNVKKWTLSPARTEAAE